MSSIDNSAITVGEMKMHGVEKIWASCGHCGKRWQAPIDILPSATSLAKIAQLIICPTCGERGVKVSPATPGCD